MSARASPAAALVDDEGAALGDADEEIGTRSSGAAEVVLDVPTHVPAQRLDSFVAVHAPDLSRSRIKRLIEDGFVFVDGAKVRASHTLRGGEHIVVTPPAPTPTSLVPEDIPLRIVHEDEDLLVVDKPAGLVVHPGAGHETGTLANAVLFRHPGITIGGERRPGIVHRLDMDTSGLIVVARHDDSLRALSAAFAARTVDKRYLAFCLGVPSSSRFELVTGHRRADNDRRRFTTRLPAPSEDRVGAVRRAHSRFEVVASSDGVSLVLVTLLTGRTHQIRAHLADIGHPLLQDELYGGGQAHKRIRSSSLRDVVQALRRHALHAAELAFVHPRAGTQLRFSSPLPDDLAAIDAVLRGGAR